MSAIVWPLLLTAVGLALVAWLARRMLRGATADIDETVQTIEDEKAAPLPIVIPTCRECGAIVWENKTHGNTFCQEGHKDPEIVMKSIDEVDAERPDA